MDQLLNTKLYIPSLRPNLVSRPRLIKILNAVRTRKLTIVSAPAGYGKTTLVSSWALGLDIPVCWLSLDENDNDLVRFLKYVVVALQNLQKGLGVAVLDALNAPQVPQSSALLTILVNEIAEIDKEFVLVLDDSHSIDNQSVLDAVSYMLDNIPPGMHMVMVGRVEPSVPVSRLRVAGQLLEVRSDDLRFSSAEVAAFLNDLMDLDLSPGDMTSLEERTEGWVAGLQLAALSLHGRDDKHEFIEAFSGSHQYLIDYLVEEVLSRQQSEIRTFLIQSSILDRLNASLCDATLERTDSQEVLQHLDETDLFLIPLDDLRGWYRYHHLFADFLKLSLREGQPEQILDLHRRAARWFEQNGYRREALDHLLKAGEFERAAVLVEHSARGMLERSELGELKRWVDLLPAEFVQDRPWLCVYHAWTLRLSGSPYKVVEHRLRQAELALESYGWRIYQKEPLAEYKMPEAEAHELIGSIIALHAFQAVFMDNLSLAKELATKAKSYHPNEDFVRSAIGFALGWAYRLSGDLEAASMEFGESRNISLASGNIYVAVATSCRDASGQILAGNLNRAMESFQDAVQIATDHDGRQLPVAGYAYVYIGGLHLEWNDLESATSYLLEGIELCKRVGYIMDQVVGFSYLTRLRIIQDDLDAAGEACLNARRLSDMMKGYMHAQRWVDETQIRQWAAEGNFAAITKWVQTCGLRIDDEIGFARDIEHTVLARALVILGRARPDCSHIQDALILLDRLLKLVERAGWVGKQVEFIVLKSTALQLMCEESAAVVTLGRALSLAEPEGYVRTFVDEGAPMRTMLSKAVEQGMSPEYASSLLNHTHFKAVDQKVSPAVIRSTVTDLSQGLMETLTERELVVLRLLASDLSGPEIADELFVAVSTVRYHTNHIYEKLSVHNRRSAVSRAKELGLL